MHGLWYDFSLMIPHTRTHLSPVRGISEGHHALGELWKVGTSCISSLRYHYHYCHYFHHYLVLFMPQPLRIHIACAVYLPPLPATRMHNQPLHVVCWLGPRKRWALGSLWRFSLRDSCCALCSSGYVPVRSEYTLFKQMQKPDMIVNKQSCPESILNDAPHTQTRARARRLARVRFEGSSHQSIRMVGVIWCTTDHRAMVTTKYG
jgi:hypothetical protein